MHAFLYATIYFYRSIYVTADSQSLLQRSKSESAPFTPYLFSVAGMAERSLSIGVDCKAGQVLPVGSGTSFTWALRTPYGTFLDADADAIELSIVRDKNDHKYHVNGNAKVIIDVVSSEDDENVGEFKNSTQTEWRTAKRTPDPQMFPLV